MKEKKEGLVVINAFANSASRVWSVIVLLVSTPIYIKILGEELFGLIGIFTTLQSIMVIMGAGLSTALSRDFGAGEKSRENGIRKYKLLRSVENIYFIISIVIISICYLGSNYLATSWLNPGNLDSNLVAFTISIMGFSIAMNLLFSLYSGCLQGLEKQLSTSVISILWSFLRSAGAIVIMYLIAPDIRLLFASYIISDVVFVMILRFSVIKSLGEKGNLSWNIRDFSNLRLIWRFSLGVFAISIISTINTQLDKVIISKYLSILDVGAYTIAVSLSQLLYTLIVAIAMAIFPRFVYFNSISKLDKLKFSFLRFNKIINLLVISTGAYIAIYSDRLVFIWTQSQVLTDRAAFPALLLSIGYIFLSLQVIPYNYLLARGITKYNNIMGIVSIVALIIILPLLINNYGLIGAAISFLGIMLLSTAVYLYVIYRNHFDGNFYKYVVRDTLLPMLVISSIAVITRLIFNYLVISTTLIQIAFIMFCGLFTLIITFLIFDRHTLKNVVVYLKFYKK